ncbi:MAG: OpgC domain-containing protein [Chloroflexota bacterium]
MTESGRDLRIDFLRGIFVVGMIVDHVAGASWLYLLTGGNRFYASAAEGFVFVSGIVAGRAYTRTIQRDGMNTGLWRLLKRAGQLYLLGVGLTLLLVPASELLHLPWAQGWDLHDAWGFVLSTVTLHRTYYLVDVTLLYVLVLIVSVLAFVVLEHGLALAVLAASWLLWLAYQVAPDQAVLPWPITGNNLFFFAAWQVLFFTGLVIGHDWNRLAVVLRHVPRRRVLAIATLALALAIVIYNVQDRLAALAVGGAADPATAQAVVLARLVGKSDLRPGRLFAFALVFTVLFLTTVEFWPVVRRWSGWLFLPLGQNALFAYALHMFIAVGVAVVLRDTSVAKFEPTRVSAAMQIGAVLLVWLLVKLRPLRPSLTRQPAWLASPALVAVGLLFVLPRVAPAIPSAPSVAAAGAGQSSAEAEIARAYGTAIPIGATPAPVRGGTNASPVAQPAPSGTEQPLSASLGLVNGMILEPEFFSAALNQEERYFIYLPPGFRTRPQRYPVLYMLHGIAGNRDEWLKDGLLNAADQMITSGELPAMLIVLPQGDRSFWINHPNGGPRWGDYLVQDLIRHIDASYPTKADAQHRALGGLSMGGWGALYQGFLHPDVFGTVGAHAPSLNGDSDLDMSFLGKGDAFNKFDPVLLASTAGSTEKLRIYLDASEHDPWLQRDLDLKARLEKRKISVEWHQFPGQHGGLYWHEHVSEYLRFYAKSLAN